MATIFDIQRNSYVDGPGIRTTVFLKGCNLRCAWCHNPESHSPAIQMLHFRNRCISCGKCGHICKFNLNFCEFCGKCTLLCPVGAREICGKDYSAEEVLSVVKKDCTFYNATGGGVTFSGGECMLQIDFLEQVLRLCRENGIHTAVDTAGHVPFDHFERILPYTDLFLYDVKCLDFEKHIRYTGVDNERILENLKKLLATSVSVWVRIPIIPGVNDSKEEMIAIRRWLEQHGWPERIELLPYHGMGEHKYGALGLSSPTFSVPDAKMMKELRAVFNR